MSESMVMREQYSAHPSGVRLMRNGGKEQYERQLAETTYGGAYRRSGPSGGPGRVQRHERRVRACRDEEFGQSGGHKMDREIVN
jgi:hypothetical protein